MDYKEISKLFIEYDGDVQINPFAKMHWGILKTEDESGKLYVDDNKNFGIVSSYAKSNRKIRDFSTSIVGEIKTGDYIIKRFFYKDGYKENLINYINQMRSEDTKFFGSNRDVWFTHINMEHSGDKAIPEALGSTWISSKIDAVCAEVRGIYYCGTLQQQGILKYEDICCCKFDYPMIEGLDDFTMELDEYVGDGWGIADHQKSYGGKEKTWTSIEIIPLVVTYGTGKAKQGLRGELNEHYVKRFPIIEEIVGHMTSLDDCLWLAVAKVSPERGIITRHSDKGIDKMNAGIQIGKTARIHYPLKTNKEAYFELQDLQGNTKEYHMKQGEYWYMDKRKPHAVYNHGDSFRYHMIFDTKINQDILDRIIWD
tara:strand:- start:292 stop:1398 length:1107 start_codon:yes stop_codon:yes gene_type:complete